jgi:hypothetical protein
VQHYCDPIALFSTSALIVRLVNMACNTVRIFEIFINFFKEQDLPCKLL